MFRAEVAERAGRLAAGASACATGEVDPALANDLYREGHPVKGTARMMGFTAIADAGKLLEEAWKGVHDGEVTMTPALATALEALAAGLENAVDGDPRAGPPVLAEAVQA